jgi:hypothetical protein
MKPPRSGGRGWDNIVNSTEAPTASRTRTRTRERAAIVDAARAGRQAQRRLADLAPKGRAPYAVLLGIITEVSLYSRLDDRLSVGRLMQVTGLDRRSVQRGLAYLVDNGIVGRLHDPRQEGRGTPRGWIVLPAAPAADKAQGDDEIAVDHHAPDVEIEPEDPPMTPPVMVSRDAPGAVVVTPRGGVRGDAPSEKSFFPRSLSEKNEKCENDGNSPSHVREVGRSSGPPSRSPGKAPTVNAPTPRGEDWCDEAKRAHALALAKATAFLEGVPA